MFFSGRKLSKIGVSHSQLLRYEKDVPELYCYPQHNNIFTKITFAKKCVFTCRNPSEVSNQLIEALSYRG
jgi:hypothetical protein